MHMFKIAAMILIKNTFLKVDLHRESVIFKIVFFFCWSIAAPLDRKIII
jgi:hypothetical protein